MAIPVAGRTTMTGLPASRQVFEAVWYGPMAAKLRLTFPDPPFVLRSTTTMSFPVAVGEPGVRGMISGPKPVAWTTNAAEFEKVPSGFCTRTSRLPARARSTADREVAHWAFEAHDVGRADPAIHTVDP